MFSRTAGTTAPRTHRRRRDRAQNAIPIPNCASGAGQAYCTVPVRERGIAWDLDQRENFGQVRLATHPLPPSLTPSLTRSLTR